MKIHHELAPRGDRPPLALAIGFFDGFHRGHRALIETLRPFERDGVRLAALSFRRHPLAFLRPKEAPRLLVTAEERINLLAKSGIQELYLINFTKEIASLSAGSFLEDILVTQLRVVAVSVGMNFRFGAGRLGDIHLAAEIFAKHKVVFEVIDTIVDGGMRISSTRIRRALTTGCLAEVDVLLGRPYRLGGLVILGTGRGHDFGFPTANLAIAPELLLPMDGVYACRARYGGDLYSALLSIGTNPTFEGTSRTVEVWMRHFSDTIYGHELVIEGLRLIRGQRQFTDVSELKRQMQADATVLEGMI